MMYVSSALPEQSPKANILQLSRHVVCRSKAYEAQIPSTSEEFNSLLMGFYEKHGRTVSAPIVDYVPLDLERIFRIVAARGGYDVVTLNKCVVMPSLMMCSGSPYRPLQSSFSYAGIPGF